MSEIYFEIKKLADKYKNNLENKVKTRIKEMENDNNSHYLIYKVLGIDEVEGKKIDIYQNKGRFLYKYAGSFLEEATMLCFKYKFKEAEKIKIENNQGLKPKKFEIDCLIGNEAYEIKWRDATTDGDHITKEHTRVKAIKTFGYIPVRIMFFYPNREQAKKIQEVLEDLYIGMGGKYYYGDNAWKHIFEKTGIDLLKILERIVNDRKYENKSSL